MVGSGFLEEGDTEGPVPVTKCDHDSYLSTCATLHVSHFSLFSTRQQGKFCSTDGGEGTQRVKERARGHIAAETG